MRPYHIDDILITPRQLALRVDELAREMAAGAPSDNLVVIGILRGSFIFLADLVRWFSMNDMHPRIDFMIMESYGKSTTAEKEPIVSRDCGIDVAGADVVVVDDILDTGRTLQKAVKHLKGKGARSVRTCVLLDKPARRAVKCDADFVGFKIEDAFVVGYGLDYDGRHRELPHITQVTFTDEPEDSAPSH
jgi:hypoxanthine phosphoribosyltransferase